MARCHLDLPLLLGPWGRQCPGKARQNCLDASSSSAVPGLGVANRIFSNLYHDFYSCVNQKNTEESRMNFFINSFYLFFLSVVLKTLKVSLHHLLRNEETLGYQWFFSSLLTNLSVLFSWSLMLFELSTKIS